MASQRPWLRVVHHDTQRRVRQALISGFCAASVRMDLLHRRRRPVRRHAKPSDLVPLATADVDIVQGYKIGRGDSWYRKVIGRTYHHGVKLPFGSGARHRLRLPAVPATAVHRPTVDLDQWCDLRRDDVSLPTAGCSIRRGAGEPLLPAARPLAVLPVAGDRCAVSVNCWRCGGDWSSVDAEARTPKGLTPEPWMPVARARPCWRGPRPSARRAGRCGWSGHSASCDRHRRARSVVRRATTGRSSSRARRMREVGGLDSMLLDAPGRALDDCGRCSCSGVLHDMFGIGSYLPYLVVLWATHVGVVVLARLWMVRLGVTAWTSTLMTTCCSCSEPAGRT